MVKIPLKWVGGKRKEIKFYKQWLEVEYNRYIEVFGGGLSTLFYLNPKNKGIIINDLNEKLMQFYHDLAHNREQMIEELKTMENTPEFYYKMRDAFNGKIALDSLDSSIFMYINKTCFSGMQRYNSKNEFNTPYGHYKTFHPWNFLTEEASNLLKRATMMNDDFEEVFKQCKKGDLVFLDPPYLSTFSTYTIQKGTGKAEFTEEDHIRLHKCFVETEAKCLMVISDLGIIRELYNGYIKEEYDKNYAINVKNRMKDVTEARHLIIANYDI